MLKVGGCPRRPGCCGVPTEEFCAGPDTKVVQPQRPSLRLDRETRTSCCNPFSIWPLLLSTRWARDVLRPPALECVCNCYLLSTHYSRDLVGGFGIRRVAADV